MARADISPSYWESFLRMIASDNLEEQQTARLLFLDMGNGAAEMLIAVACHPGWKHSARIRFLQTARSIGVRLSLETLRHLQQLIEGKNREISEEASKILADASPAGALAIAVLSTLTGVRTTRPKKDRTKGKKGKSNLASGPLGKAIIKMQEQSLRRRGAG